MAGLKAAQRSRPSTAPRPKPAKMPRLNLAEVASKPTPKAKTIVIPRRQAVRAETELPTWNDQPTTTPRAQPKPVRPTAQPAARRRTVVDSAPDIEPYDLIVNARHTAAMRGQLPGVDDALHLGLDYLMGKLVLTGFYPDHDTTAAHARTALMKAARDLDDPRFSALLEDKASFDACALSLVKRIPNVRGAAKSLSDTLMHPVYKVTADTPSRASALKTAMTFIYSVTPDTVDPISDSMIPGHPDRKKPYSHTGISQAVVFLFKKARGQPSVGERLLDLFPVNDNGNSEAPAPLVALAAAAIFSSLDDYTHTPHKRTDFDGSRVEGAYNVHMGLLKMFETKQPIRYHETMEMILRNAAGDNLSLKTGPSALEDDAYAMADFQD
ncbi:hypothetical protein C8F01DRAFT_1142454 [Mycena amicta]|nr:hypothetical protein C8F01DRAFT_1142454 [Mycena amicta]